MQIVMQSVFMFPTANELQRVGVPLIGPTLKLAATLGAETEPNLRCWLPLHTVAKHLKVADATEGCRRLAL